METDLFATKGAEYVLVIVFLAALAVFWRWLSGPTSARHTVAAGGGGGWFRLMDDCLYHPGHGWTRVERDGLLTVGIDDFSQHLLGPPDGIDLPAIGTELRQGTPGLRVEVAGKSFEVLAPVSGEVVEVNREVLSEPGLVNDDPYRRGWLLKVRPGGSPTGLRQLLSGSVAREWLRQSEASLRRQTAPAIGIVMQDGGQPVSGIARAARPEDWDRIIRDFLLNEG